jgi:hypothetical protein
MSPQIAPRMGSVEVSSAEQESQQRAGHHHGCQPHWMRGPRLGDSVAHAVILTGLDLRPSGEWTALLRRPWDSPDFAFAGHIMERSGSLRAAMKQQADKNRAARQAKLIERLRRTEIRRKPLRSVTIFGRRFLIGTIENRVANRRKRRQTSGTKSALSHRVSSTLPCGTTESLPQSLAWSGVRTDPPKKRGVKNERQQARKAALPYP